MIEENKTFIINPTTDFVFKRIFGTEDGKICLISLLNAIFNGNPVVNSVKFLNAEPQKDDCYSKASRLDIEAEINDGTIVNVELQCVDNGDLGSRSIVYASKLIAQHTKQGQSYKTPKVISIWIIRDKVTHGPMANRLCPIDEAIMCLKPNQCISEYTELVDKMRIIFVHLYRFKDKRLSETMSMLMRDWAKFFVNDQEGINSEDNGINRARYLWIKLSSDDEVKAKIRAIEKYEMDKGSELAIAKEEGLAEGLEKGLQQGQKEGEHNAKIETATNLLSMGLSVEQISKATGLFVEEIKQLL